MLRLAAVVALVLVLCVGPAFAADSGTLSGRVLDGGTGLALQAAVVSTIGPTQKSAYTNSSGRFSIEDLAPGAYQLRISLNGYQTTLSDTVVINAGDIRSVTLAVARQATGGAAIRTIGRTVVTASGALQRSAVIGKQQSIEPIERAGVYRTGDYLRTVPAVNLNASAGGTDTPSPGDDIYLDIRGIGGLENLALLNGHPIGYGIIRGRNVGYDWEVSPTYALRAVEVTFGSGIPGLTPYSAAGGVVDMLTLEPTPQTEGVITQGFGTYSKLVTTLNLTGTAGKVGYALALGTQSLDGPYKAQYWFQPTAAFDPSAPHSSYEYSSGIYKDDTAVVNRGDYLKLRFPIGNSTNAQYLGHLSLSALSAYWWDDKTGNGDQDNLPYDTALATGNALLASYVAPPNVPPFTNTNPQPCGAGTFTPSNPNGNPWGYGINGMPDGGTPCVTPQQYAATINGLQGAGATYQTFTISDYNLRYDQPIGVTNLAVDVYTNRFYQLYDRTYQQPFFTTFGDNPFWLNNEVNTTGEAITDRFTTADNDIGFGFAANNYAYNFHQNGVQQVSPIVWDDTLYVQDIYHPGNAHYKAYFNAAEVYSKVTHTSVFNPRLSFVQELPANNTLRVAAGVTSVQPYATYVDLPYSATAIGALASFLNCTGLTSIGQVANPLLTPERANDQELSFGHGFANDSLLQLTFYNENVNNKIFPTVVPVSTLPAGLIPPATISAFETAINAACGTSGLNGVGVNVQANVGRDLAKGIDIAGRARFTRKLFLDFDYAVESTALRAADVTTLQNNLILIVGAQLPGVPLHKAQVALDAIVGRNIDLRLTQYYVSGNNSKNSVAYNYGDFTANVPVGSASSVNFAVSNVFNQYTGYNGQIGHGVPLALNQYATPSNYTPLIGTAATELFGLPNQQFFVSYSYHFR